MPGLGFDPKRSVVATAEVVASGRYCTVAAPTAPRPKAFSLTGYRLNYYNQGQAGTCWVHSPKMQAEMLARKLGKDAFAISRHLIGWWAKRNLEGGGNPSDGGSPTDAIRAMVKGVGVGMAHEAADPYRDDSRYLGTPPSQSVIDDAGHTFLLAPVIVPPAPGSLDRCKTLIASGFGVCTGIPWPGNWENPITFHTSIGQIVGGHSELWCGYIEPGVVDQYGWLEMENWRELPYPPLPPSVAKQVDGYESVKPDRTNSHWIRQDVFIRNCKNQVTEFVSATDLEGLESGVVDSSPSFGEGSWL